MKSLSETAYCQAGNIKHGNLFCFSDIIVNIVKDTEKKSIKCYYLCLLILKNQLFSSGLLKPITGII